MGVWNDIVVPKVVSGVREHLSANPTTHSYTLAEWQDPLTYVLDHWPWPQTPPSHMTSVKAEDVGLISVSSSTSGRSTTQSF